ncbi:MBL fold metallo-hydrolase [Ruminococcaceae bacterium OttesenSCG-928-O06]|nr:MBL fold metallo-hydrolase [Ruminococcaceae bacterium OttesenSCG-928-O06]
MQAFHLLAPPPYFTNCFLLIGSEGHAVAIDPAADVARFEELLNENKGTLTHIFLTHGHMDHVSSVEPLREKYGAKLYMSEADAKHFSMQPDELFTDFGTVAVDDMTFTTIFTPGHTPGSLVIQCDGLLFTGDTLFAGDIGRTDFPGGSMEEMKQSLKKLRENIEGDPQVLPGHEEFSTFDREKKYNPYMKL